MTTEVESVDLRVRRPRDREPLIEQLLAENDGVFERKAEVMLFAAALGWARQRREPFEKFVDPIRFNVFQKIHTGEAFIEALAVLNCPGDAQILSDERALERINIFEEYANGGLAVLQGEINASRSQVRDVLVGLVREAANADKEKSSKVPADIRKLITRPDWS
ncbi:DNA phosphorothioation-associated protein 4 [Streptomyces sp. CA-135486]|uniref:DNA phosphorothioation-associated protein 4 n=1 Tax=Streptomyces sp. CA-135486 TaxID=3240049 RepID=UPI003D8C1E46